MMGLIIGFLVVEFNVKLQVFNQNEEGEGFFLSQFNLVLNIGYFLFDQFVIGIGMDYIFSVIQELSEDCNEDSNLLFGFFLCYYVFVGDDMVVFFQIDFGFGNVMDNQVVGGE